MLIFFLVFKLTVSPCLDTGLRERGIEKGRLSKFCPNRACFSTRFFATIHHDTQFRVRVQMQVKVG